MKIITRQLFLYHHFNLVLSMYEPWLYPMLIISYIQFWLLNKVCFSKSLYSGDLEKRVLANSQLQLRGITIDVCKKNIHISVYDITCYMQITSILGHYFRLKVLIIFQETSHEFS